MAMAEKSPSTPPTADDEPSMEPKLLECGLCFENDDLKRLICHPDHIYCVTCLTKDSELTKIVKCPLCRTVFDESIDDIPSAGAPLDKFICCDVCMRKDDKRRLAQIYCVICQKKFCKPHMDGHNFALDDHKRITMDEYKKEYRKVEIRYCEKHTDRVYSLACKKCNEVFCVKCMMGHQLCTNNSPHHLLDLQVLNDDFVKLINNMKLWIFDKEECLLGIVKQITRILSVWDSDTEEMITELHDARDHQIEQLQRKYDELEKKLISCRSQSKVEVTSFLDDNVGSKLEKISRGVKRIDSRIYYHHQVDIVRGIEETEKLTNELMNIEIPEYKPSENHVKLVVRDTESEAALDIKASDDPLLSPLEPTRSPNKTPHQPTPPQAMTLLRVCKVSECPYSVCHHGQYTYVGCEGSVDRISEDGQVQKGFLEFDGYGSSITVADDKLSVLVVTDDQEFKIQYHGGSNQLFMNWTCPIQCIDVNKHRIIDSKIIIPDSKNKQLGLYSFTGNLIKQIPCDLGTGHCIAMATVGDNSLVVTVRKTNTVFRINIDSGEVMWTSDRVRNPQGVVCYKNRYVLVTNSSSNTRICILDVDTGEYIGELTGKEKSKGTSKFDMDIYGDTLIVADYTSHIIEYYQLT